MLQHWDLHACGAPRWSTSCDNAKHPFDVIMIRDALQHIPIAKAKFDCPSRSFSQKTKIKSKILCLRSLCEVQEILRKVILDSGAKWFITSSYPDSDTLGRSDLESCHSNVTLGKDHRFHVSKAQERLLWQRSHARR